MNIVFIRCVAVVTASLALGACQAFPLFGLGKPGGVNSSERALATSEAANPLIELGRKELDRNRMGAALASFRTALGTGEDPGAALNGIGVAYAKMGRLDTAERLFAQALAADPGNERYARNLQRASSDVELARNRAAIGEMMTEAAHLSAASADLVEVPLKSQIEPTLRIADSTPTVRSGGPHAMVRVSPAEVTVRTVAGQRGTRLPSVDSRFKPIVRLDIATRDDSTAPAPPMPAPRKEIPVDPRFKPIVRVPLGAATPLEKGKTVTFARLGQ